MSSSELQMADHFIDDLMGELNQSKTQTYANQNQEQAVQWTNTSDQFQNNQGHFIQQHQEQIVFQHEPPLIHINSCNIYSSPNLDETSLQSSQANTLISQNQNQLDNSNYIVNLSSPLNTVENNNSNNTTYVTNQFNGQTSQTPKAKKSRQNLNSNQANLTKARSISSIFNSSNTVNEMNASTNRSIVTETAREMYQIPLNIQGFQQIPHASLIVNNSDNNNHCQTALNNISIVIFDFLKLKTRWKLLSPIN